MVIVGLGVVGLTVGEIVGDPVGASVGDLLGDPVGEVVGDSDGDSVGDSVGDSDGFGVVGEVVGESVGDSVGDLEGDSVGDPVGESVGVSVGDLVGFGVGQHGTSNSHWHCFPLFPVQTFSGPEQVPEYPPTLKTPGLLHPGPSLTPKIAVPQGATSRTSSVFSSHGSSFGPPTPGQA